MMAPQDYAGLVSADVQSLSRSERASLYSIRSMLNAEAGLVISDGRLSALLRRVMARMSDLDVPSLHDYAVLLSMDEEGAAELQALIDQTTTNKTSFFREEHHFHHLKDVALPHIGRRVREDGRPRVRIWSAGCATGEEAWSLAMVVRASALDALGSNVRILATDINRTTLQIADRGLYRERELDPIPAGYRRRYMVSGTEVAARGAAAVDDSLRSLVTFKALNLLSDWPMAGPFDVIFCRNVVIYFDGRTQADVFDRLGRMVRPGGFLYVGHSETLPRETSGFRSIGRSIYERLR